MKDHPLSEAAARAGGVKALCEQLQISLRTYSAWRHGVPAYKVVKIAQQTGIAPERLNPALAAAFRGAA